MSSNYGHHSRFNSEQNWKCLYEEYLHFLKLLHFNSNSETCIDNLHDLELGYFHLSA